MPEPDGAPLPSPRGTARAPRRLMVTLSLIVLTLPALTPARGDQYEEAGRALDEMESRMQGALADHPESSVRRWGVAEPEAPGTAGTTTPPTESLQATAKRLMANPEWRWAREMALKVKGSLTQESAWRTAGDKGLSKFRNQAYLSSSGRVSDDLKFLVSGRAYYDLAYAWTHHFSADARHDQQSQVELRDTYLDYSQGDWDVRLGKQQVVWGEAVAVFYADQVNARDLREFILPDMNMIRIPQWGADVEYTKNDWHAELVWMQPEFDKLGQPGSAFYFAPPVPPGTSFTATDPQKPAVTLGNSEIGTRLSRRTGGWDLGAFALHGWTKSPVNWRTIDGNGYHLNPDYRRLDCYGATVATELNDTVYKGELVWKRRDYFATPYPEDTDGVIRRDSINYLLGADRTFFGKLETNLQLMQQVIPHYSGLIVDQRNVQNSMALRLKTSLDDGRVEPELTVVSSLNDIDVLFRPLVNLRLNDHWTWRLGADIFGGNSSGMLGQFDKQDRVYSTANCTF